METFPPEVVEVQQDMGSVMVDMGKKEASPAGYRKLNDSVKKV
jgi:hypothetical protein